MTPQRFCGRVVLLGTQHGKERALARPLRAAVGAGLLVVAVDTDRFGTFSGEVPRVGSARDAARRKVAEAFALSPERFALASEGSFGPNPQVPLLPQARELLLLADRETGLEVVEDLLSVRTNFRSLAVPTAEGGARFLQRIGFPAHALIVRPNRPAEPHGIPMHKGVQDAAALPALVQACAAASVDGLARLEPDMRAHLNPTRMAEIRRAGFRLARRLATACPACASPGFGPLEFLPGLPCEECGGPTDWIRAESHGCAACPHREERPRSDGRLRAPAGHCPNCNP